MKHFLLAVALLCWVISYSQTTFLDSTFSADGIFTSAQTSNSRSMLIQPDGKLIVGGDDFFLHRLNTNGTLDSAFGTNGVAWSDILGASNTLYALAFQPDGKIVAAGRANEPGLSIRYHTGVVRFLANGKIDSTFSGDGKLSFDYAATYDMAFALTIQPDGKIITAGWCTSLFGEGFALARILPNGTLDSTFSGDGKVKMAFPIGRDYSRIYGIVLQPNGKIVVAGYAAELYGGGAPIFALARFNTNGIIDSTFGQNGNTTADINGWGRATCVELQPDGKILIGGYASGGFDLMRFNSNGSIDSTFNEDGRQSTPIFSGEARVAALKLLSNGQIVVAGQASNTTRNEYAITRYHANGDLDSLFGINGIITLPIQPTTNDKAYAMVVQPDGKIVVTGVTDESTTPMMAVVRLIAVPLVNKPTAVEEISDNLNMVINPNPATNQLTINLGGLQAEQVNIYNVDGKLVSETKQPANNRIDISNLAKGVYIAEVKVRDVVQRVKWVKM